MGKKKSGKVINYPQRPKAKRPALKGPKLLSIAIIGCISIALFLYIGQLLAYRSSKQELKELEAKKEEIEEEKMDLQQEVGLLQEEEYIEMKARKHLGMVRQGEIIFFVVE